MAHVYKSPAVRISQAIEAKKRDARNARRRTSRKLRDAVASFVAMGFSENEARKMVDDTLRDTAPKGTA
jgi:Holliday junction resolvasome RuvABC DNA-binding subunit